MDIWSKLQTGKVFVGKHRLHDTVLTVAKQEYGEVAVG
jgi:hypothetical protein